MHQFTDQDIRLTLALARNLANAPHGRWFGTLNERNVTIDSNSAENDTLNLGDCSIVMVEAEVTAIIPTMGVEYLVYIPKVIPGSYWEPDDVDMVEVAQVRSLSEAIGVLYMQECQQHFDSVVEFTLYEVDQEDAKKYSLSIATEEV